MLVHFPNTPIDDNCPVIDVPNGIQILTDDGTPMFIIKQEGLAIRVSSYDTGKHQGVLFDDTFTIRPINSNSVVIKMDELKRDI